MNDAAVEGFRIIADKMSGRSVITAEQLDKNIDEAFADLTAKLAKLKAMMTEA